MTRPRPAGQLDRILDAAEATFVRVGLERAKMAVIAASAGVSESSLYYYFESKESLFGWTLLRAGEPDLALPEDVPLAPPPGADPTSVLGSARRSVRAYPSMRAALAAEPSEDLASELRSLLEELYDESARNRRLVDLVESMAVGNPQLRDAWYSQVAKGMVQHWARYFEQRASVLELGDGPFDAATFVIVNCNFFARTRHRSAAGALDDDTARATVIETIIRSLVPR